MNFIEILHLLATLPQRIRDEETLIESNIHAEAGRTKKHAHLALMKVIKDPHLQHLAFAAVDAEIDEAEKRLDAALEGLEARILAEIGKL